MYRNELQELIKELNKDIALEYAQAIQYIQHANMILGMKHFAIIDELIIHGNESFEHAKILSEIVAYLGGDVTTDVGPRFTSTDNDEMLRQDLMLEYEILNRYIKQIPQLESFGMYDSAQRIRNITIEEQDHINELETALGIDKSISTTKEQYMG